MAYTYDEAAKNLLAGKDCASCKHKDDCHHPQLRNKFSTCWDWELWVFDPASMLKVFRLAYPNSIKGGIFKEFAMESTDNSIKYIKPIYNNKEEDEDRKGSKIRRSYRGNRKKSSRQQDL